MKSFISTSLLVISVLSLPACDRSKAVSDAPATPPAAEDAQATAPAAPELTVRPAAAETTSTIDWDAARRDLAARPAAELESVSVAAGGEAPPVPLMLPGAELAVTAGEGAMKFQPLEDGYFANIPGAAYNITINGTNRITGAPGATATREAGFRFLATSTGAHVTFSKYGADYLVEFECNDAAGAGGCITEEAALNFAKELDIAGTR